ncbi:MAG: hypothetical protein LBC88_02165 [Spirochaetaceae bacterium]|jgi:hypothetical protein|nr:hypothetical protein [Spirochaetaceae bacterium]
MIKAPTVADKNAITKRNRNTVDTTGEPRAITGIMAFPASQSENARSTIIPAVNNPKSR